MISRSTLESHFESCLEYNIEQFNEAETITDLSRYYGAILQTLESMYRFELIWTLRYNKLLRETVTNYSDRIKEMEGLENDK